ncbi:hypothetical protein EDD27_0790 [Nonomuraea polychroma]|uniref:Uncharacterized protein n=1 Tax=Nonomuraea polychroma TaxID=46176 RepID=A0A438LYZ4_9ACTN|nr:hypothetical protein [Nonomuraea polychroma]RVX38478.1 hypothetical protein EDD27_0790 [Nonomuraea polychroma]
MWTAILREDKSLLVPFHADLSEGWHADSAVPLRPGDSDYDEHLSTSINAGILDGDRTRDEELIANWEAQAIDIPARRSA